MGERWENNGRTMGEMSQRIGSDPCRSSGLGFQTRQNPYLRSFSLEDNL
ncbi:MAG: hypothetical protein ACSW8I_05775 [bacterium]